MKLAHYVYWRNKLLRTVLVVVFLTVVYVTCVPMQKHIFAAGGDPEWAKSSVSGNPASQFYAVTNDSAGNTIGVGFTAWNTVFDLGDGVTVTAPFAGNNILAVKYTANGSVSWARTTVGATQFSRLYGVSTDSAGNIYAVGDITGTSPFDFGNGVTLDTSGGGRTLIIKYSSSGDVQWAKTTVSAPGAAGFTGISVDASGNSYVTGSIANAVYDFGSGVTVTGIHANGNPLLIKYDTNGVPQWAVSLSSAPQLAQFTSVSTDADGNIYVGGMITETGLYDFGNGVTVSGSNANSSAYNPLIVKYNSSGIAQWAKSTSVSTDDSNISGITTDQNGNSYAVGRMVGTAAFDFGNGVSASGAYSGDNSLIIKYNSSGLAQWAKSTETAVNSSLFRSVKVDSYNNIHVAGIIRSNQEFNFGNSVTVQGGVLGSWNTAYLIFNSQGDAVLAQSNISGLDYSQLRAVSTDVYGNGFAVGLINSQQDFDFGNGVVVHGTAADDDVNLLLIKYSTIQTPASTPTPTPTPAQSSNQSSIQSSSNQSSNQSSEPQQESYQISECNSGVFKPVKDSDTGGQQVTAILPPNTFTFNAFLSSRKTTREQLISSIPKTSSERKLGLSKAGSLLGVKTSAGTGWQVGNIQEIWYKAYPPRNSNNSAARIIPTLQNNPSIISLGYSVEDLRPPAKNIRWFNPANLRIAYAEDGLHWRLLSNSVIDQQNRTVSALHKVGGYYMIVAPPRRITSTAGMIKNVYKPNSNADCRTQAVLGEETEVGSPVTIQTVINLFMRWMQLSTWTMLRNANLSSLIQ